MPETSPTLLITGAADRIGAAIAEHFHAAGYNIALHYRQSRAQADALAAKLQQRREASVLLLQCDLADTEKLQRLPEQTVQHFGRLDILINNASTFFPTPLDTADNLQWQQLMDANLKGPFFLAQAAAKLLRQHQGCIINLVDIYAEHPLQQHPIYCMAKAGNQMMVKSLAVELGPEIRVNGIAPGAILWPSQAGITEQQRQAEILAQTPLKRCGAADDIARTALFLATDNFISGQIIKVDGGRSVQR
ncbi:pteridine reductase [Sinobacterium caligoides]|uniref:Pteridine reductase n=1 Tax=Sinobacterium caligoides TaxID=933926 RepID=A0A3N2DPX0_9GAMM|nr:pteridine reductase [Sinobacterium caligoides]ROS01669.1 pteridine reductase [Sinobacterium caligoides]